jgi:GT2 family glycosyltransferase
VPLGAQFFGLTDRVILATQDHPGSAGGARASTPLFDGEPVASPYAALDLPLAVGGHRTVIVFRIPADVPLGSGGKLAVRSAADAGVDELGSAADGLPSFHPDAILVGLAAGGAMRLARLLFDFCCNAYRLNANAQFVDACRRLVQSRELATSPAIRVDVAPGLALAAGPAPTVLGAQRSIVMLGPRSIAKSALPAYVSEADVSADEGIGFLLLFDHRKLTDAVFIVVLGDQGIAIFAMKPSSEPCPLLNWLRQSGAAATAFRRYLACGIAAALTEAPEAKAALREMQLLLPLPATAVRDMELPVGGEVELAVAGEGGLFLSGWLHDAHGLIAGLRVISPFGTNAAVTAALHRFPREDIAKLYATTARGDAAGPSGFAVYLPQFVEPAPALQYRVDVALRSGATLQLVTPMAPGAPRQARDAVLRAIPPRHLTQAALVECIAPTAAALHRACMAAPKTPELIDYGRTSGSTLVSLVVPIYRNLDYLRAQHAALALDPGTHAAELIYVLDSPEQRAAVDRILRGLYATYGKSCRLAVMPANSGFAAACNAGAALGSSQYLLPFNSDVVPAGAGWLGRLTAMLKANATIGAVGAKLLYHDDSLQHAGLYFVQDADGTWRNSHFHKGYPRDYPEANSARSVPGVTGAVMLLRRDAFEQVGGFSEEYVIGDYEDSDLCLKLRAAGFDVWYQPAAELYHFERRSLPLHGVYWRSNASEYNRLLHTTRWREVMAGIRAEPAPTVRAGAMPAPRRRRTSVKLSLVGENILPNTAPRAK